MAVAAPFLATRAKEARNQSPGASARTWQPVLSSAAMPGLPAQTETTQQAEERLTRRDVLAANAQKRYNEWHAKQDQSRKTRVVEPSYHHHNFRPREKKRELASEWAGASKVLTERDRINRTLATSQSNSFVGESGLHSATSFPVYPPYPKEGGGGKNGDFSYMHASYDLRARLPSKEVAGTTSTLRVRPRTESSRINEAVERQRPCDALGGGRWTFDPSYGNPVTCLPLMGSSSCFRKCSKEKWLTSLSPRSDTSSMKWRGSFSNIFPPATASQVSSTTMSWLHHTEPFADRYHDNVAVNERRSYSDSATMSCTLVHARDKKKEIDDVAYSSQVNPSEVRKSWSREPSPMPPRLYSKSIWSLERTGSLGLG